MIINIEIQVLNKIKISRRGTLFFTDSFLSIGNAKAVNKALQRLVEKGEIKRVDTGIYVKSRKSKLFGFVMPGLEEIAHSIAKRDKARIVPTGVFALNQLGLSTQVPMNLVYLTDGAARTVKVGNRFIKFKKTTPKNLSAKGEISSLVIQGLRILGKDKILPQEIEQILILLKKEKQENILHDMKLAPEWIRQIFNKALKKNKSRV
jgi:hypothetical protein